MIAVLRRKSGRVPRVIGCRIAMSTRRSSKRCRSTVCGSEPDTLAVVDDLLGVLAVGRAVPVHLDVRDAAALPRLEQVIPEPSLC
jgi:hypothetical protein